MNILLREKGKQGVRDDPAPADASGNEFADGVSDLSDIGRTFRMRCREQRCGVLFPPDHALCLYGCIRKAGISARRPVVCTVPSVVTLHDTCLF